ncbi:MAG: DUF368 domain-containing protein [Spartobacteria bacterium]|nr:DUF368 domain-containing protein [Spartobacteria bacterium]
MINVLKGFIIGVANIIPGVSGGTLALVLGIYQRMISCIHHIDAVFIRSCFQLLTFKSEAFKAFGEQWKRIEGFFLMQIMIGAVVAIVVLAKAMEYLLQYYHAASYAFFFGLVLVSIVVPFRYLRRRSIKELLSFVLAIALMLGISFSVSESKQVDKAEKKQAIELAKIQRGDAPAAEKSSFISLEYPGTGKLLFMFAAGMIAISAMVLPGISGSFVLLMMGAYFNVLSAVNHREVFVLMAFMLGCLAGLAAFSRIMDYLLAKFFDVTMSFMIGLMAGSLYVLWPFKKIIEVQIDPAVELKTLYVGNLWPPVWNGSEWLALGAFVIGCAIVAVFVVLDKGEDMKG